MRYGAYSSREESVLPGPDEIAIGGEDVIDDCDSIVGEDVSQELISVMTKEVPVVVQPSYVFLARPCLTTRHTDKTHCSEQRREEIR